ncbi:Fasciclin domain-containing protein [Rhizoctonia solani]|uniref:Fasciclin domain-containing protein n=1 Tax=Rhizoctonia solani TaxID=456999 RepID=A0A8H8NNX4_9AGAM|nr:Fasciclin domain-containing protein [Rhizoctonia solani]QRW16750.1 Fasciclin domain-containing protein [Rhizoctonia solani]
MYSIRFISALFAASAAVQASPIVPRQDYLTGLVQALNSANLTTLVAVLAPWATTEQGQQVVNNLPNGNYTILAPSNAAFEPVLPGLQADNSSVGPILSYHVINGSYPADLIAPARSHSIAPTLLTDGAYVNLGGLPQVQVLEKTSDGSGVLVRRTIGNATVTGTTTYQNLIVHVINTVLTPPSDLKAALSTSLVSRAPGGFSQLGGALQKVGQLDALSTTVAGLTDEQLTSVLRNHVINNNVLYSTQLANTPNANAASDAQLTFSNEDGTLFVSYNNTRARVLRSDVAVKNGVVHVIDAVLA